VLIGSASGNHLRRTSRSEGERRSGSETAPAASTSVTLRAGNTSLEAVAPEWIVVLSWLMSHAADSGERLLQAGMLFRDIPALAAKTLPDAGVLFQGPAGCQDAGV
jgi:hypothetical protein